MPQLNSEFLFTIRVTVDLLHDVGETPFPKAPFRRGPTHRQSHFAFL